MRNPMYVVYRYELGDVYNPTAIFKNFNDAWFWARNKAWEEAGWEEDGYPEWSKFDRVENEGFACMTYKTVIQECGFIIQKKTVYYEIEP